MTDYESLHCCGRAPELSFLPWLIRRLCSLLEDKLVSWPRSPTCTMGWDHPPVGPLYGSILEPSPGHSCSVGSENLVPVFPGAQVPAKPQVVSEGPVCVCGGGAGGRPHLRVGSMGPEDLEGAAVVGLGQPRQKSGKAPLGKGQPALFLGSAAVTEAHTSTGGGQT